MPPAGSRALLTDVADTAFWVASYRADESRRPDALFHDPLAERLAGEKGRRIAAAMAGSHYTGWSIVVRTVVIDRFITDLVGRGIDTLVNLGAGLDTRPYRLALPAALRWLEMDHPATIAFKDEALRDQRPHCQLVRCALDLLDRDERRRRLAEIDAASGSIAVLTEGVIPYLDEAQVRALAEDLRERPHVRYWIVDYFARELFRRMNRGRRGRQMRNAPFRFDPDDWCGFFARAGWRVETARHLPQEGARLGRPFPLPAWVRLLRPIMGPASRRQLDELLGYRILVPDDAGAQRP